MTITELKQYIENKKKYNAAKWAAETAIHGHCTPFTYKEYMKYKDIIISGKKTYKTKFVHNNLYKITR